MKNNTKLVTWITAIAVSLTIAGPLNAKERGQHNNRGSQIVVDGPRYSYENPGRNDRVVIMEPRRGKQYAGNKRYDDRRYYNNQRRYDNRRYYNNQRYYDNSRHYAPNRRYIKAKNKKLKRKIRRLRRLNNYHKFQRPIVIITRDLYR